VVEWTSWLVDAADAAAAEPAAGVDGAVVDAVVVVGGAAVVGAVVKCTELWVRAGWRLRAVTRGCRTTRCARCSVFCSAEGRPVRSAGVDVAAPDDVRGLREDSTVS
jgi:hypothetical protein